MPDFATELISREEIAESTMAFHFRKPEGFDFRAGQAIDLTLLNPPETDAEGNTRAFSIGSAPSDPDIVVATRMHESAFKRVLKAAEPGLKVEIEGPMGSLTLHKNPSKPAVFLAGGIGITPFRSMLRDAALNNLPHVIDLFYSNRRPEDAPFLDELQQLQAANPKFHVVATMTDTSKSRLKWDGSTGFLTAATIRNHVASLQGPIYYIAGPSAMVAAMRQMLVEARIDEDDIRTEEFAGYSR
jgi:ferredoxin-NADP reductase